MPDKSAWRGFAVLIATACLLSRGVHPCAGNEETLARAAPADIGLFVEIHGADDLLIRLTEPQIWSTLAELAGQPAQPADVADWRMRIRQTIKMAPEEAIRQLFAGGVAFLGEGLGLSQDAIVLCRPSDKTSAAELFKRWEAKPLAASDGPATYQLYSNIGVSRHDGLLFFGDLAPPDGLFRRMQRFSAGGRSGCLADDPVYRKLLSRAPKAPDGVFFVRMNRAAAMPIPAVGPASQPTSRAAALDAFSGLPAPWRNAQNVLLALHRTGETLRITAAADTAGQSTRARRPVDLIDKMPRDTLLAWQGRIDFDAAAASFLSALEQNPIQGVFQLREQVDAFTQFVDALDTDVCFAIGAVRPEQRPAGMPPFPALAALIGMERPGVVLSEIREVVDAGIAGYSLYAYTRGMPLLQPIRPERVGSADAFVLDLSPLLKPDARAAIGEVHLCWTLHDGDLIVTSHFNWLKRIVAAREGRSATAVELMRLSDARESSRSVNAFLVQSGPIAEIAEDWLVYLRTHKPEVFDEDWWRERQPGGDNVRLGVDVTADGGKRRLEVIEVYPKLPATGRLKKGDYIVGYGDRYSDRRFQTDNPIEEISTAVQKRPHARWQVLLIERGGVTLRVRLPIPFIAPIQALNRMVAIGRLAERAVYRDDAAEAEGPRGYLAIELRAVSRPVRDYSKTSSSKPSSDK